MSHRPAEAKVYLCSLLSAPGIALMDQQIAGLRALSITDVKPVADTETDINALPEPVRSEAKEMRAKMRGNKDRPVTWYDSVLHEERQRARDDARHKEPTK